MIALRTVTIAVVLSGALLTAAFAAEVVGHNVRPERRDATGDRIRQLQVPPGFTIDVLAQHLGNPRMMVVDDQDFLGAFRAAPRTSAGWPASRSRRMARSSSRTTRTA